MNILHIDNAEIVKNPHGVKAQKLYTSEHASILQLTLKPGEKLKKHIPPVDVVFYVLEGKGIIEIGDEKKGAVEDTIIHSPKGIRMCWYNESDKLLRFLVIKTPFPNEPTKFLE